LRPGRGLLRQRRQLQGDGDNTRPGRSVRAHGDTSYTRHGVVGSLGAAREAPRGAPSPDVGYTRSPVSGVILTAILLSLAHLAQPFRNTPIDTRAVGNLDISWPTQDNGPLRRLVVIPWHVRTGTPKKGSWKGTL
jgi:hypothetical protein